jgi:hypothetical protein
MGKGIEKSCYAFPSFPLPLSPFQGALPALVLECEKVELRPDFLKRESEREPVPCKNVEDLGIPTDTKCVKESLDQEVGPYRRSGAPGRDSNATFRLGVAC